MREGNDHDDARHERGTDSPAPAAKTACLGEEDLGTKTARPSLSFLGQCPFVQRELRAGRHTLAAWGARHRPAGRVVEDLTC